MGCHLFPSYSRGLVENEVIAIAPFIWKNVLHQSGDLPFTKDHRIHKQGSLICSLSCLSHRHIHEGK